MSVRKRKWKTSKGEDRQAWVADYVDGKGKRHIRSFKRKKDADGFSATAKVEVREGTHVADSESCTVKEAGELWIRAASQNGLERSTLSQYRQHLNLHIVPFIGQKRLSGLSVPIVRAFEDDLKAAGRSPAMVRKVLTSLSSLVSDAQERGLVAKNPVRDMRRRRRSADTVEKRSKGRLEIGVDIPTPVEIKKIIEHAKSPWRALVITAIFSGLRASELRGLTWKDVDLKKSEIRVTQRADRYNQIGPPKSRAGNRTVPIGSFVVNTLKEWKLAYPRPLKSDLDKSGEYLRERPNQEHLVFPNTLGKVESHPNLVQRGVNPIMAAAGLSYTGTHALRHFYASWCINRKAENGLELPPKSVQERLGHSSIQVTFDRYGHLFPRSDDTRELTAAELRIFS